MVARILFDLLMFCLVFYIAFLVRVLVMYLGCLISYVVGRLFRLLVDRICCLLVILSLFLRSGSLHMFVSDSLCYTGWWFV